MARKTAVQMKFRFEEHERFESTRARLPSDRQGMDTAPLVAELADVFTDPEEATMIVVQAGLPPERCPRFVKPDVFWQAVVKMLLDGVIEGGVQALADVASNRYRFNATFPRYRSPP